MESSGRSTRVRQARRLQRGAAKPGLFLRLLVFGLVFIGVGVFCKGMDWATPEMFKPLGLDLAMVITNIGIFLAWAAVLNVYYYTPYKEAIDTRNGQLEATFTEAENLKKEMSELRTSYEARLAQTESDAREQIQAQIREAQNLRQSLMAEATKRADELVKKAELEIEAEKQRAMGELRDHVVNLTINATERLIAKNVDSAVNRKLVDEFISDMAVKS